MCNLSMLSPDRSFYDRLSFLSEVAAEFIVTNFEGVDQVELWKCKRLIIYSLLFELDEESYVYLFNCLASSYSWNSDQIYDLNEDNINMLFSNAGELARCLVVGFNFNHDYMRFTTDGNLESLNFIDIMKDFEYYKSELYILIVNGEWDTVTDNLKILKDVVNLFDNYEGIIKSMAMNYYNS